MNNLNLEFSIFHCGYVHTDNIFKNKKFSNKRTLTNYELVFFLNDGGYFILNDKKYIIKSGSARLCRTGDIITSYKFNDVYSVHFMITQQHKYQDFLEMIPSFFTLPNLNESISLIESLTSSFLKNNYIDCACKLFNLLSYIQSHTSLQNKKEKNISSVKNYLDVNYSKDISLDSLATVFYLHPIYLHRKFKQEYGLSPNEYIRQVRINHAKNYLISTNMTIEEISFTIGYSFPSYFIKLFKKHEGCTPFEYRKKTLSSFTHTYSKQLI